MKEQQVYKIVVVTDLYAVFLTDKGEILAYFENKIFKVIDDCRGKVTLGYAFRKVEEIKRVSIEEHIARRPFRLGNGRRCGFCESIYLS